jgi:hypothetical protein
VAPTVAACRVRAFLVIVTRILSRWSQTGITDPSPGPGAKHYGRFLAPVSCGARAFLVLIGRVRGGQCEWGELCWCETSTRADPACVSRIWLDSASQPDWDPSLGLPFPRRPRVAYQSPAIVSWLPDVGKRLQVGALKGATMRGNHCQLSGSVLSDRVSEPRITLFPPVLTPVWPARVAR